MRTSISNRTKVRAKGMTCFNDERGESVVLKLK